MSAVTAGVLLAGLGSLPAEAAPAAKVRSWKVSQVTGIKEPDKLAAVSVTGRRGAWALGHKSDGQLTLGRWDGAKWRLVKAPAVIRKPGQYQYYENLAASSDKNVWAFASVNDEPTQTLHWDGKKWAKKTIPGGVRVAAAATVSPTHAWVSDLYRSELHRWNGKVWKPVHTPGTVADIELTSAASGWAVGVAKGQPLALRWNGKQWKQVPTPHFPPGNWGIETSLTSVVAPSPNNVWAVGIRQSHDPDESDKPVVLHWNGKKWSKAAVPGRYFSGLYDVRKDGQGGLWMRGANALFHYRAGKWTKVQPPQLNGYDGAYQDIANVPGTTSMLGVGYGYTDGGNATDGAFFATR
ncbi:hypothetical protein [Spirillospora sp. CA-294931]|uniref:hypothetical protein n=1 Tax=Spirillospora sp. CA-294931 TaxID=3240042 RepID=UPI003D8A6C05